MRSFPSTAIDNASELFRWSALSRLGQNPAVRLTGLIPFIGFFLFFNQSTHDLFGFAEFFKVDLGLSDDSGFDQTSLYYTYFGLILLGVAAALFSMFCPPDVRENPSALRFVAQSELSKSPVLAKSNFRSILNAYFSVPRDNDLERDAPFRSFPEELESDFHSLFEEIYVVHIREEGDENPEDDTRYGLLDPPDVMLGSGYLDFTGFAKRVWLNVRADWAWTQGFLDCVPQFPEDIAMLKHRIQDYSQFRLRLLIGFCFGLGLVVMGIPTVRIFWMLSKSLMLNAFSDV